MPMAFATFCTFYLLFIWAGFAFLQERRRRVGLVRAMFLQREQFRRTSGKVLSLPRSRL